MLRPVIGILAAVAGFGAALSMAEPAAAGSLLDRLLPRARDVCYVKKSDGASSGIKMIRIARPERFQALDGSESRHVRIVVNFAGQNGARFEDNASCSEDGDRLRCLSASCDGAGFLLYPQTGGAQLIHGTTRNFIVWGCGEDKIRTIAVKEDDRSLALRRGSGSCLE